jgi:hypothetical protein
MERGGVIERLLALGKETHLPAKSSSEPLEDQPEDRMQL